VSAYPSMTFVSVMMKKKKKKTEVCGRTGSRFFGGGGKIMERM